MSRIDPVFEPKIWGSTGLAPWFPDPEEKIGEVIFRSPELPLIKFLFTTERLSVQVHPDDEHAHQRGLANGKTEMWYVMRAAPGAQVGVGFRRTMTNEGVLGAIEAGNLDSFLNWVVARPGDVFFVPAGTVHAIGAGLTLCEIQQQSDTTYRLFDYGRNRELHVEDALAVAQLGATNPRAGLPVRSPFFRTEMIDAHGSLDTTPLSRPSAFIALTGEGLIGDEPFLAGSVHRAEAGVSVHIMGRGTFLRTFVP